MTNKPHPMQALLDGLERAQKSDIRSFTFFREPNGELRAAYYNSAGEEVIVTEEG